MIGETHVDGNTLSHAAAAAALRDDTLQVEWEGKARVGAVGLAGMPSINFFISCQIARFVQRWFNQLID